MATMAFVALAISFQCTPSGIPKKTYTPNSKSNPPAPAFANISYGKDGRNKLNFEQTE